MKRNEAVRQEVLELDDHQCQICGATENLHVHHWKPLGMGGSEEKDVPENMITLCAECHEKVHAGKLHIERWDRAGGILAVTDMESRRIPDEKLWFYRRKLAEELKPILETIQGIHQVDGQIAYALYRLKENDAYKVLDPDARSFREFCASQGWEAARAVSLAKLYEQAKEAGIEWPPKMTATDFKRQLKDAGKIKSQSYWYVIFEPLSEPNHVKPLRIVHTGDFDALMDEIATNEVAVRVGKWIKVDARNGELKTRDGVKIAFNETSSEDRQNDS